MPYRAPVGRWKVGPSTLASAGSGVGEVAAVAAGVVATVAVIGGTGYDIYEHRDAIGNGLQAASNEFDEDQQALIDLAKWAKERGGLTPEDGLHSRIGRGSTASIREVRRAIPTATLSGPTSTSAP